MILPNKYIEPAQSLFYLGAIVLDIVKDKSFDIIDVWLKFKEKTKGKISYTRYLQTLVYLYSTGAIFYNKEGEIYNEGIRN